uniref:DNA-directed RNA polymerase RpoA/D/Rpb3-type domain-containing protein n=1 Tax=viral metagenome TaxID=1070528 RepID=A0A6C0E169_9ZZZZ
MNPKIDHFVEEDNTLTFTLTGVDVSFANAIRRTILSDIPTVVFKTMPYEENKATILENTTRLNNEILKQRLSCIPIHITDLEIPLNNYLLEINEENLTDTVMYVTTKHFKIKNVTTNTYLEEKDVRAIFPPYVPLTGKGEYYIDFVRLRPKISDEILGEKIKLTCEFSVGTAREDSMFNVVGTCSYGYSPDPEQMNEELKKRQQAWKDEGKNEQDILFESSNWKLLEGLRYVKKNSFDFILQSVGVFENAELIVKACDILLQKFKNLQDLMEKNEVPINDSVNTMDNCYDVILENEDYTMGNVLNYILYKIFYQDLKVLSYCGFKKMHPHDSDSIIRLAFNEPTRSKNDIRSMFKHTTDEALKVFDKIRLLAKGGTQK